MNENLKGDYLAISKIREKEEKNLFARSNVTAVGVGHKITEGRETGDHCLTVFVEAKLDRDQVSQDEMIPKTIGKYKTDVIESGIIFAGISSPTLKDRLRPAKGGYSVGHFQITAGTIATCVVDSNPTPGIPAHYYILSNNHVLANSNNGNPGDPILQPGPFDGGINPADVIAKLARFIPINFSSGASNLVDCAIAEGDLHNLDREIYWIGHVKGITPPTIGMTVHKTGRTTGHTSGTITAINASVNVNYGGGRVANFAGQIITSAMSAGGDSGSLVLDDTQENAVGLLFAGSATVTICNNIAWVMRLLKIKFH